MSSQAGKIKISLLFLAGVSIIGMAFLNFNLSKNTPLVGREFAEAAVATTTITVLNTPPQWTVDAQEQAPGYNTSTPANAGSPVVFLGTGTDPNNDNYYLLICKTSSTPTAVAGGPPICGGGGGNQWAVSATTTSATQASSTYVTSAGDAQFNVWFAWICDGNISSPACNSTFKQGTGATASPFVVNHRPNFSSVTNTGPQNPGASITWNAVASDTDNFTGSTDTVQLWVCKANDFNGASCGAGGTYCTSTLSLLNPSCAFTLPIPTQDKIYNSYPNVVDQHNFAASGGAANATSTYTVNDVAPTISSSTVSLLNTVTSSPNLVLTVPSGQTSGFMVKFTVSSNNSCLNASGGQEIASATANVYRSGITQASCQTSGNYNPNNCYPAAVPTSTWNLSCSQDAGSCSGSSSLSATWTCTFPLWYVSDPTDGTLASDTQFFAQTWLTSVKATDDNGTSSPLTESATGTELQSFLAYNEPNTAIAYPALSPGQTTDPIVVTTTLQATGNVGLNETLYGDDMCTTYSGPGSCPSSTTSTIAIGNQKNATSSVAYASAFTMLANPGSTLSLQVTKSTSTSTPSSKNTFWGISVPASITLAGAYTGQNTLIGVKSPAQTW